VAPGFCVFPQDRSGPAQFPPGDFNMDDNGFLRERRRNDLHQPIGQMEKSYLPIVGDSPYLRAASFWAPSPRWWRWRSLSTSIRYWRGRPAVRCRHQWRPVPMEGQNRTL